MAIMNKFFGKQTGELGAIESIPDLTSQTIAAQARTLTEAHAKAIADYKAAHYFNPQYDPPIVLNRVRVRTIENGYLVEISYAEGETTKQVFIKDLDELGGILVAGIVARRIEK